MKNILFCGNKNMFDGILTSILSILKRSEYDNEYTFYVYTMKDEKNQPLTNKQIEFLNDIVIGFNNMNKVIKIDVTNIYNDELKNCPALKNNTSISLIRLLVDKVPNMPDKLLYLATDIIFNKDINFIYDIDINDYEYAMGYDLRRSNKMDNEIVLMNMNKIKESNILVKTREILKTNEVISVVDEAVLPSTSNSLIISKMITKEKLLQNKHVTKEFSKLIMEKEYNVDKVLRNKKICDIFEEYVEFKNIYCGYYMS